MATTYGRIHVEQGKTFRRTHATVEQVVEAIERLIEVAGEGPIAANAMTNAARVVTLLGHSLGGK